MTPSAPQRTRRAPWRQSVLSLVLAVSLLLSGCPVSSVAGSKNGAAPRGEEPGPPSVLDPTLLDRG